MRVDPAATRARVPQVHGISFSVTTYVPTNTATRQAVLFQPLATLSQQLPLPPHPLISTVLGTHEPKIQTLLSPVKRDYSTI